MLSSDLSVRTNYIAYILFPGIWVPPDPCCRKMSTFGLESRAIFFKASLILSTPGRRTDQCSTYSQSSTRLNVRLKVKRVATKGRSYDEHAIPCFTWDRRQAQYSRPFLSPSPHHHCPRNPSRKGSQRPPAHCSEIWTQYTQLARLSPSSRPTGTYFPHPSHCK